MSDSKTKSAPQAGENAPKPALPLFYTSPAPVTADRHSKKKLAEAGDYRFAANANSVPLNGTEFGAAMRHYPIVFTRSDNPFPVALLGLRPDINLMVDEDGTWEQGTYIPDYVRRYPFIFVAGPERDRMVLCIDEASSRLNDKQGEPLYDADSKPTKTTQEALDFCGSYQQRHRVTQAFATALMEHGLLVEQNAQVTLADGTKTQLHGFTVVDVEKLNRVRDETFLEWRQKGWLPLIYLHLASAASWGTLVDRAALRGDGAPKADKPAAKAKKTATKEKADDKAS